MKSKSVITLVILLMVSIFQFSMKEVNALDPTSKLKNDVLSTSKAYQAENKKLKALEQKTPAFTVQGEILNNTKSGLLIWGIAVSPVNGVASSQDPGWQVNNGNLMIINPLKSKINYMANMYADELHYYVKTIYGTNTYGSKVAVKVYTKTPPSGMLSQQKKSQAAFKVFQGKLTSYEKNIISQYKGKLASTSNMDSLRANEKQVKMAYDFVKQYSEDYELTDLILSYCNKIKENAPNDLNNLYALADIYNEINDKDNLQKTNVNIARVSPEAYIKRMNVQTDINSIITTLQASGYPEYAVNELETYISKDIKLENKTDTIEKYVKCLYSASLKYKGKNDNKKELEFLSKADQAISKYQLGEYYSGDREMFQNIFVELSSIYLAQGDLMLASKYLDLAGTGDYNEDKKAYANDDKFIELAEMYVKQGDLKNGFKYFDQIVNQYNLYNSANQNIDINLKSANVYSNLLLGLAYLSHTRLDHDEFVNGLKYVVQAYKIDPNNAKVNNALGYVYHMYYPKNPEKFKALESSDLSEQELAVKVLKYYMRAIEIDPSYKIAYGNLNSIYEEDYNDGVKNAIIEINKLDKNDNQKYYSFVSNMKNELFDKSFNKHGIEGEGDF